MNEPFIPPYSVKMRHPKFGWNPVHLANTREVAMAHFDKWRKDFPQYSFTVLEIGLAVQSWKGIAEHIGTYDYSKGDA